MARVPELGELIADRYRIQALAREGPGYLTLHAFDRDVEVEVSLLWFRPGLFPSEEARRAFLGDAVTIRGLAHPHLRRVYEAHVYNENAFATAQVGSASTVVKRLGSQRPADELDVIRYATAIGEGLEAAHRLGLIHGYLVPSDVVEVSAQVKVTGVGLYRAASRDVARDLFWTRRRYLAPEVLSGGDPTVRSDVYSMAAVLSEIASGVSGSEIGEALEAASRAHPRIADALERALSEEPGKRHASVGAVLDQLRRHLVDDRVPTAEQPAIQASLDDPDTSRAIVIEAEEPPESATRRATTQRPIVTQKLLDNETFDPSPISLLHADGDPMAAVSEESSGPGDSIAAGASSPWSSATTDDDIGEIRFHRDADINVGDKTVEIDFESKTREYRLGDSVPFDDDDDDDPPLELTPPPAELPLPPSRGHSEASSRSEHQQPSVPLERSEPSIQIDESFSAAAAAPRALEPEQRVRPASVEISAPDPFAREVALDPSPRTLQAMPPPPAATAAPVFVSKKPQPPPNVSPPTPIIPALERPGMQQPVLKPIRSTAPPAPPQAQLGRYAPPRNPRESEPEKPRSRAAIWLWAAAAVVAIVFGGLLAVVILRSRGNSKKVATPDAAQVVAAVVDAAPVKPDAWAGPCPPAMLHAEPEDEVAFCIDKFEAAGGEGGLPRTEVTFAEAEAACQARKARLCSSAEWAAACRGPEGASYPYGKVYLKDACNSSSGRRRTIEASGNYPECESAVGAFDMSGNVAEWTAEGFIQGGSATDYSSGRCSKRYRGRPTKAYKDVGYRCCADPLAED